MKLFNHPSWLYKRNPPLHLDGIQTFLIYGSSYSPTCIFTLWYWVLVLNCIFRFQPMTITLFQCTTLSPRPTPWCDWLIAKNTMPTANAIMWICPYPYILFSLLCALMVIGITLLVLHFIVSNFVFNNQTHHPRKYHTKPHICIGKKTILPRGTWNTYTSARRDVYLCRKECMWSYFTKEYIFRPHMT